MRLRDVYSDLLNRGEAVAGPVSATLCRVLPVLPNPADVLVQQCDAFDDGDPPAALAGWWILPASLAGGAFWAMILF